MSEKRRRSFSTISYLFENLFRGKRKGKKC
jgi:hypothetical protein